MVTQLDTHDRHSRFARWLGDLAADVGGRGHWRANR